MASTPVISSQNSPDNSAHVDESASKRLGSHTAIVTTVLKALYASCLEELYQPSMASDVKVNGQSASAITHYCSMRHPCSPAKEALRTALVNCRLVCQLWYDASFQAYGSEDRFLQPQSDIEPVYYPHAWHINSKVRYGVLHGRYRVFKTIDTDDGVVGVFRAYDYGSTTSGCHAPQQVVVKAWLREGDEHTRKTETRAYEILTQARSRGEELMVPRSLAQGWNRESSIFSIVIEDVGPSLDSILSSHSLTQRQQVSLAIQLISCYSELHKCGIIHNGVKPGNICVHPRTHKIHIIDFGISYFLDSDKLRGATSTRKDGQLAAGRIDRGNIWGNRRFLSALAQSGMVHSQRDDLESLGYLFSYLHRGSLPWSGRGDSIWRIKMATPMSVLFDGMDVCFLRYWKDVKSLAFGEAPDYNILQGYFVDCWERKGFGAVSEIDWMSGDDGTKDSNRSLVSSV